MQIICVDNLSKAYNGRKVIDNVSFCVNQGEVFGLLGPSGAGKTTIINILIGLVENDGGTVSVLKCTPQKYDDSVYSSFGVLLDNDGLYERLSCFDNLDLFARIYNIPLRKSKIDELLEKVGLQDSKKKKVSDLSKGMRQRLAFARSILHSPKIVFLDEPTSGLDPNSAQQIHLLIKQICSAGTTVFLTTHNMAEAQQLCDHIVMIDRGNVIESGTPNEIRMKHRKGKVAKIELDNGKILSVPFDKLSFFFANTNDYNIINSIHSNEPSIEEIFISLTGRDLN